MKYSADDIRKQVSYHQDPTEWWMPSDVCRPVANNAFKYACKKLTEQGILECDNSTGRWGKSYRFKKVG